jgi:hypothetical protein
MDRVLDRLLPWLGFAIALGLAIKAGTMIALLIAELV